MLMLINPSFLSQRAYFNEAEVRQTYIFFGEPSTNRPETLRHGGGRLFLFRIAVSCPYAVPLSLCTHLKC